MPDDDEFDDDNDDATQEQLSPKELRLAADRGTKATKRLATTEARVAELERENAVYRAGLTGLKPVQIKALLGAHEGELTPELLKATAVALNFAEADEEPGPDLSDEINGHTEISNAAAGAGRSTASAVLKPEDVNDWPIDRQMRLNRDHPDVYERLMQGETVSGFAFV